MGKFKTSVSSFFLSIILKPKSLCKINQLVHLVIKLKNFALKYFKHFFEIFFEEFTCALRILLTLSTSPCWHAYIRAVTPLPSGLSVPHCRCRRRRRRQSFSVLPRSRRCLLRCSRAPGGGVAAAGEAGGKLFIAGRRRPIYHLSRDGRRPPPPAQIADASGKVTVSN